RTGSGRQRSRHRCPCRRRQLPGYADHRRQIPGQARVPLLPGGEAAGVVASVGARVKHLKPGDRVMGLTGYGSFAEKVKADASRVLPMPDDMDYVTAAGFSMTYGTSMHA